MSEGEFCPQCKKGQMYFQGKRDANGSESNEPFNPADEIKELVCNNCGYKLKAERRSIPEDASVGDKATGTVTRIDTQDKVQE
jgi:DNA-directed RNA polymerase subunit M/transcription elongation factor TFIIS